MQQVTLDKPVTVDKKKDKPCSQQRMVRPRTNNLAATVFVFERTRKPYETHVVYLDQASCYVDHPKWKHTATLDPAAWIEHLLNNPQERYEQIESICSGVKPLKI